MGLIASNNQCSRWSCGAKKVMVAILYPILAESALAFMAAMMISAMIMVVHYFLALFYFIAFLGFAPFNCQVHLGDQPALSNHRH